MSDRGPLLRDAVERLMAAGVGSPQVDAELLLAYALGVPRSRLLQVDAVPDPARTRFDGLIERRANREPLQHLLGTAAFRYLELAVGPGVFVPRPETELIVDAVLPALRRIERPVVVDLCSGSGALALAVADEVPAAVVVAVERSPLALTWLRSNIAAAGRSDRVSITAADVAAPGDSLVHLYGTVDVVVSNPPYVPTSTVVGTEVGWDPPEAVFAGADGLELIPSVIALAARLLRPGGTFAMEHDTTQGESAPALMNGVDWTQVAGHRDLAGQPRFVTAIRTGSEAASDGQATDSRVFGSPEPFSPGSATVHEPPRTAPSS